MKNIFIIFILLINTNFSSAQGIKNITPESYIAENPSFERQVIINNLIHQFDNRKIKGISQSQIDNFYKKFYENNDYDFPYLLRFQIVNQKLYAAENFTDWFPDIISFLQTVLTHYKINDVDFTLYHCEKMMNTHQKIIDDPFFLFSKSNSVYDHDKFLFPDFFMMKDWLNLTNKIKISNKNYTWDEKKEEIFWRGMPTASLSGLPEHEKAYYGISVFDKIPRLTLVMLSKLYPKLINAKFTENTRVYTELEDVRKLQIIFDNLKLVDKNRVPEVDHLKYKYLISIDGNTAAWKRVPWIMLSNSVLVKQETDRTQWFYPALKPYFNYVPVNEEISDIFSRLEWMKNNDKEVRKISINAQRFIENELMPENIEAHVAIILNEYHKLHKGEIISPTLPSAEETLKSFYDKKETEAKESELHRLSQNKKGLLEKAKIKSNKIYQSFKKLINKLY